MSFRSYQLDAPVRPGGFEIVMSKAGKCNRRLHIVATFDRSRSEFPDELEVELR